MLCYCCCVLYCSIWFLFYSTLFFLFFLSLSFSTWFTTNYRRKIQIQSSLKLSNTFVLVSFLRFFSGCSVLFCSRASFSVLFLFKENLFKKISSWWQNQNLFFTEVSTKIFDYFFSDVWTTFLFDSSDGVAFDSGWHVFFILTMPRSQHYLIKSD